MIRIRPEQLHVLDAEMERRFAVSLAKLIRDTYAADVAELDDDALMALVIEGIHRAEAYGFDSDDDVRTFVRLLFTVGWHFDEHPAIAAVLQASDLRDEERMSILFESVTREEWEEAHALEP
jgi:hypothetical protein